MRIGHNKVMAGLLVLAGGASLILGLVAGTLVSIGIGVLVVGVGVLYFVNPTAVIAEAAVEVRNPFGITLKRIPYGKKADLSIRDGALWVEVDGSPIKAVGGMSVDQADIAAVEAWLKT